MAKEKAEYALKHAEAEGKQPGSLDEVALLVPELIGSTRRSCISSAYVLLFD